MNTKTLLATVAGAVFNFLGGWVVFGMLLMNFYKSNAKTYEGLSKGEMPDLIFIFISGIFSAYLVTYVVRKAGQGFSFATGFKHGLAVYFCMAAWANLAIYAFYNLNNVTLTLTDIFVQAIFGGVNGGIIALVLGSGKKE
jgi:hypothetical protein